MMSAQPADTLVRETVGGEAYEYYPLTEHVVLAPGVSGGEPTFKYTRIGIQHALGLLASGMSMEEVAHAYRIQVDAVREALRIAVEAIEEKYG